MHTLPWIFHPTGLNRSPQDWHFGHLVGYPADIPGYASIVYKDVLPGRTHWGVWPIPDCVEICLLLKLGPEPKLRLRIMCRNELPVLPLLDVVIDLFVLYRNHRRVGVRTRVLQ